MNETEEFLLLNGININGKLKEDNEKIKFKGDIDKLIKEIVLDENKLKEYLVLASHFDNLSPLNILLIQCQNPLATFVAPYDFWQEKKTWIKRGEKSMSVLDEAYIEKNKYEIDLSTEIKKVFDVSQTSACGDRKETFNLRLMLNGLLDKSPTDVVLVSDMKDGVYGGYLSEDNKIRLRKGCSNEQAFVALAYEQIKYYMHQDSITNDYLACLATEILALRFGIKNIKIKRPIIGFVNDTKDNKDVIDSLDIIRKYSNNLTKSIFEYVDEINTNNLKKSKKVCTKK